MRYRFVALALVVAGCHALRLGEPAPAIGSDSDSGREAWSRAVAEIISMYDRVPGVQLVVAGGDSVRVYLDKDAAVPIVSRVLHAAGPEVQLYIIAPKPGPVALGATSAGFPPENIVSLETGDGIILRAMRAPPVPSAQSSPRQ